MSGIKGVVDRAELSRWPALHAIAQRAGIHQSLFTFTSCRRVVYAGHRGTQVVDGDLLARR
jgi:hypothetical protein